MTNRTMSDNKQAFKVGTARGHNMTAHGDARSLTSSLDLLQPHRKVEDNSLIIYLNSTPSELASQKQRAQLAFTEAKPVKPIHR